MQAWINGVGELLLRIPAVREAWWAHHYYEVRRHPVIPHVAWTDQLQPTIVQHLLPVKRRYGWQALIRAPFFKGRWVTQVIPKTMDREASDATLDVHKRKE